MLNQQGNRNSNDATLLLILLFWDHFAVIFYSDGQCMTVEKKRCGGG